jgi:hypothetical protein
VSRVCRSSKEAAQLLDSLMAIEAGAAPDATARAGSRSAAGTRARAPAASTAVAAAGEAAAGGTKQPGPGSPPSEDDVTDMVICLLNARAAPLGGGHPRQPRSGAPASAAAAEAAAAAAAAPSPALSARAPAADPVSAAWRGFYGAWGDTPAARIQTAWRGWRAWRAFRGRRLACIALQAAWRGRAVRLEAELARAALQLQDGKKPEPQLEQALDPARTVPAGDCPEPSAASPAGGAEPYVLLACRAEAAGSGATRASQASSPSPCYSQLEVAAAAGAPADAAGSSPGDGASGDPGTTGDPRADTSGSEGGDTQQAWSLGPLQLRGSCGAAGTQRGARRPRLDVSEALHVRSSADARTAGRLSGWEWEPDAARAWGGEGRAAARGAQVTALLAARAAEVARGEARHARGPGGRGLAGSSFLQLRAALQAAKASKRAASPAHSGAAPTANL